MTAPQPDTVPLCVTCGVCCTDAFFRYSNIRPEESARVRALGFPIEVENGREMFTHGCVHLDGAVCKIYEARPVTCRNWHCATLKALDEGSITRDEADRRVTLLKAAVARVRRYVAEGERIWEFRPRVYADPKASPESRIALVGFDRLVDRYFKAKKQRFLE